MLQVPWACRPCNSIGFCRLNILYFTLNLHRLQKDTHSLHMNTDRQNLNRNNEINDIMNQMDLSDTCRTFHPNTHTHTHRHKMLLLGKTVKHARELHVFFYTFFL